MKLKFNDFRHTTVERQTAVPAWELYEALLEEGWQRSDARHVRLLGAGVRFQSQEGLSEIEQLTFFEEN